MTTHHHRNAPAQAFLLLHGWQNRRPAGHWQHWLTRELRALGLEAHHPQLPDPDHPDPGAWTDTITGILHGSHRAWTVICHSLSCVAWLHLCMRPIRPVERLLFVAPPSITFLATTPELREFVPPSASFDRIAATSLSRPRLACSDRDPYCEPPAHEIYPDAFDVDVVPRGGHLDMGTGLGPWPELLDWCRRPETRIGCRSALAART
ncbi:MAG TPA: alpha/beta hydrolase [Actinoplanes sp.]|jgi:hypothetical protein